MGVMENKLYLRKLNVSLSVTLLTLGILRNFFTSLLIKKTLTCGLSKELTVPHSHPDLAVVLE